MEKGSRTHHGLGRLVRQFTIMRYAAVIPAYNESQAIESVVAGVNQVGISHNIKIVAVVVNDCSTDDTGKIINNLNCIAIHLPVNLGIGGAVQSGMKYAFRNGFDYAFQVDGDGQHPASEIPKLILSANETKHNVTIGSRFLAKEGFQSSAARRAGIQFFTKLNKLLTGVTIHDPTSGFRLLDRKALAIIQNYYPDEYPEPESLVIYSKHNLTVSETPVMMRERDGGVSSIGGFDAIYYMFKVSLASIFSYVRTRK